MEIRWPQKTTFKPRALEQCSDFCQGGSGAGWIESESRLRSGWFSNFNGEYL